nr:MAG TPA: hypothetical protein [Caudoviricetes sp.]
MSKSVRQNCDKIATLGNLRHVCDIKMTQI